MYKLTIKQEVLDRTTKCEKGFCCLSEARACPSGRVDEFIHDLILFVDGEGLMACPYRNRFGDSFICNCPTRQELYRRYRI